MATYLLIKNNVIVNMQDIDGDVPVDEYTYVLHPLDAEGNRLPVFIGDEYIVG